ncbi:hypothetical protein K466DRAFT_565251 [Polyporus arcularius HHB13444]|uniref:Uncharacterized protein n=1 Tax=Polyporus arcularius HHB13444 TaxID=1314778 RepID=A0A5C3PEK4_9APHY|nr:hypothetical protein K466DRAFT_565251 [Polyporus arcularius HHB13444]
MNFTVDDADPTFAYSTGWAVQSDTDADRDEFFQGTYHAATADEASMSFQFQGSAFALYGSKGPGHAKYQVQFDSTVATLDAYADETAFRQELFSHVFSPNGTSAVHLVKVTALLSGDGIKGKWLDVDYITFTSGPGTTSSIGTATSTPPWETETASSSANSSLSPFAFATSAAPSSASSSKAPTVLAILFGVLIGIALFILAIFLVLRRIHSRRRARERAFRYGQSSVNPSPSPYGGARFPSAMAGSPQSAPSGSGIINTVTSVFSPRSLTPGSPMPSTNYEHMHDLSAPSLSASASQNALEMGSLSLDALSHSAREGVYAQAPAREGAGTPSSPTTARPLMSTSPIAWTRQKVAGGHTGDADSLRTDFLQV